MNICILGNSHVAALKLAWDEIKVDYINTNIVFVAGPGAALENLEINNNEITSPDPKTKMIIERVSGQKVIDLRHFDLFIIYGLGYSFNSGLGDGLSQSLFATLTLDKYINSLNYKITKLIRKASASEIFIMHTPLRAVDESAYLNSTPVYEKIINKMDLNFKDDKILFLTQPKLTKSTDWATKKEFTKGSLKLDISENQLDVNVHDEADIVHMNKFFGIIYVNEILNKINQINKK